MMLRITSFSPAGKLAHHCSVVALVIFMSQLYRTGWIKYGPTPKDFSKTYSHYSLFSLDEARRAEAAFADAKEI
jgi:hypothetical protein